jgi:T-complex protein 1 subunit beta
MIGEDMVIKVSGCKAGEACSIVLRGSGFHILDEIERSIHDAIFVLVSAVMSHRVVY